MGNIRKSGNTRERSIDKDPNFHVYLNVTERWPCRGLRVTGSFSFILQLILCMHIFG